MISHSLECVVECTTYLNLLHVIKKIGNVFLNDWHALECFACVIIWYMHWNVFPALKRAANIKNEKVDVYNS